METKRILPIFALAVLILASCTTQKLAQQVDQNDDVYYSLAKAKEAAVYVALQKENSYVTDEQLYGDGYHRYADYSDYSDYDYASRIYRFHSSSPWRTYYYDGLYNAYNPYAYNPYRYGSNFNINIGLGSPNGYYNDYLWGYSPYYRNNFWNPYSGYGYNSYTPYYGGSYYYGGVGNGYYNGNNPVYATPNYRARPGRGYDNIGNTGSGTTYNPGATRVDGQGRVSSSPSRAERYGERSTQPASTTQPNSTRSNTPERTEPSPRPSRTERYTPPPSRPEPTYTPPPSNSGGSSRSGDSNSSGSSSSGSRPSR